MIEDRQFDGYTTIARGSSASGLGRVKTPLRKH